MSRHYCTHCADVNSEIRAVRQTLAAWADDSFSRSMIRFINHKGLSEEWARFMLAEIHEKIKPAPPVLDGEAK